MAFSQSHHRGRCWGKLACGNHKNKLTTKCQCRSSPVSGPPSVVALPKKVFQRWPYMKVIASTVPMEWMARNGIGMHRELVSGVHRQRQGDGGTGIEVRPHSENVILVHKVATLDLLSGWLGMRGSLARPGRRVWDSLRLYLFLVSSSDTWRQLSRRIGLYPSFHSGFVFTLSLPCPGIQSSDSLP